MLINFCAVLKDIKDVEIKEPEGNLLTLKTVCVRSLLTEQMSPGQMKSGLSATDKLKLYQLAVKIENSKEAIDITTDEIVKIKNLIAELYTPLICGQAVEMLENGVAA